ncbi:hypothetical protein WMZ97_20515 [Lentibacillus sp. N15]
MKTGTVFLSQFLFFAHVSESGANETSHAKYGCAKLNEMKEGDV